MRPEEIMIGDVLEYMGTIVKVYSIGAKICVKEYFGKNTYIVDFNNLLKGLELTPEILEKNFKSTEIPDDPYGAYFYESNEYIEVYIKEYTDGLWEVVVDEIEFSSLPTWKMYVSNVHEIQHALRLCGIDKK